MPVVLEEKVTPPLERQMELPMAVLLKLQTAARHRHPGARALARVRGDMLPEKTRYRDDGCEVHPQCLTCPLPRCRYDEPGGLRGMLSAWRDRQVVELRSKGAAVEEIAEQFGVSRRTVFRILTAKYREARCA